MPSHLKSIYLIIIIICCCLLCCCCCCLLSSFFFLLSLVFFYHLFSSSSTYHRYLLLVVVIVMIVQCAIVMCIRCPHANCTTEGSNHCLSKTNETGVFNCYDAPHAACVYYIVFLHARTLQEA